MHNLDLSCACYYACMMLNLLQMHAMLAMLLNNASKVAW